MRKPRPDARLKNLPVSEQAKIAELLRGSTLNAAVSHLRIRGIVTSRQALGRFLAWWNERQREENLMKTAAEAVAELRKKNPEITTAEIMELTKQMFMLHAMSLSEDDPQEAAKLLAKLQRRLSI